MWREITKIEDMEKFALLRNDFGCSVNYTADKLKHNIENKIDCKYFIYETDKFKILLGFKYHQTHKMLTLMTFTFIVSNINDYLKIFDITAKKMKEVMEEKNLNLINEYGWEELQATNLGIGQLGYWKFLTLFKERAEKIGLIVNFDEYKFEVRL